MTNEQLSRLLNTACDIITSLEDYYFELLNRTNEPDVHLESRISALFDEIKYSDELEDQGPEYDSAGFSIEDRIVDGQYMVIPDADAEAQDFDVFGDKKI